MAVYGKNGKYSIVAVDVSTGESWYMDKSADDVLDIPIIYKAAEVLVSEDVYQDLDWNNPDFSSTRITRAGNELFSVDHATNWLNHHGSKNGILETTY